MTSCSLLISTYNWPEALNVCLQSAITQSILPGEIIIADDGSKEETQLVITDFKKISPVPVKHIWQEDDGFQLAKIRNKGIAAASKEYIIQIDGDLILHKHFIQDHLNFSRKGFFTTGSRVLLSEKSSTEILKSKKITPIGRTNKNKNLFNSLRIPLLHKPLSRVYKNKGNYKYYVKGCNMAFWKKDLLTVNGYNESFTGWGREDSEIAIRLMNAGIKKRFLKFGGVCYHLHHKIASKEMEQRNIDLMNTVIRDNITWAKKGVDQYF